MNLVEKHLCGSFHAWGLGQADGDRAFCPRGTWEQESLPLGWGETQEEFSPVRVEFETLGRYLPMLRHGPQGITRPPVQLVGSARHLFHKFFALPLVVFGSKGRMLGTWFSSLLESKNQEDRPCLFPLVGKISL